MRIDVFAFLFARPWMRHVVGAALALLIFAPVLFMLLDREPTYTLISGNIIPSTVHRGDPASVIWYVKTTNRSCPGKMQRDIVDSRRQLWPYVIRERAARFVPDPENPGYGWIETPTLLMPEGIATGPATYHVTVFWYCNWLQEKLEWPVVVDRPAIRFEVAE